MSLSLPFKLNFTSSLAPVFCGGRRRADWYGNVEHVFSRKTHFPFDVTCRPGAWRFKHMPINNQDATSSSQREWHPATIIVNIDMANSCLRVVTAVPQ
jgi:hypothetical protein